jgi:hypothetical protein
VSDASSAAVPLFSGAIGFGIWIVRDCRSQAAIYHRVPNRALRSASFLRIHEFKTMTGLGDRSATDLVSSLLRIGYLASDSAYGKVRFAIPRHALPFLFPALWPEAEQDQALISTEMRHGDLGSRRSQRLR